MLRGACLCGKARYEISGPPKVAYFCHCGKCRKQSGSSFATNMIVRREDFAIVSGEGDLSYFQSSPRLRRYFCSGCGSPIYSQGDKYKQIVSVRCGTLDSELPVRPSVHAFVGSKASWEDISDELPQFPEYFA